MQESFEIEGLSGEQTLEGKIEVRGSKNAALLAFPATLLFKGAVTLTNIPEIEDVKRIIELLEHVGATVEKKAHGEYTVTPPKEASCVLDPEITKRIRASVFMTAPLLSRYGDVSLPYPGGDNIGPRPVNLFVDGLTALGATCEERDGYHFSRKDGKLVGNDIFLKIQSVGVTQSLMLAAVLAQGTTTLRNVAMEPEIVAVAEFLNTCGAKISGAGTPTMVIEGGELLEAQSSYVNIPDRLETGTFLILGVLSGKDITITNCDPSHLVSLFTFLNESVSSEITFTKNTVRVQNKKPLTVKPLNVRTHEYPGFPTDLQPPFVVLLTQAEGKSLVFETIFEERFNYVGNLVQMGAQIKTYDPHRIRIHGKTTLRGSINSGPDVRAGLAYVMAAIVAEGKSTIHNVYVIDRGYEEIEKRLSGIGVSIKRCTIA